MKNPTHTYKGQPVELLELTYEANGWQYGTIEMFNKVGKLQRQTVQVRNLTPLAPDGAGRAVTLSGLYNCQVCGEEKCRQPGICEGCLTPPPFQDKINELLVKAGRSPVTHRTPCELDETDSCDCPNTRMSLVVGGICQVCQKPFRQ